MDQRLPPQRPAAQPMGIAIAAQQQQLEHQHRAVPDVGRAAQLRQRQPCHQRLDQEQQETAREDDEREQGAPGSLARDRRHVLVHRIPIE